MVDLYNMFEPLSAKAKNLEESLDNKVKLPKKTPVIPVPDNAPEISYTHQKYGKPTSMWAYQTPEGALAFYIARFDYFDEDGNPAKIYLPISYCDLGDSKFAWAAIGMQKPRLLYNLPSLMARLEMVVIIVEGEKAVDAAASMFPNYIVITSPHGANAARYADWVPVKGRHIVVWPDNDDVGTTYANDVAKLAYAAGAQSVKIVQIPTVFPTGWDLADELPDGIDIEIIYQLLQNAKELPKDTSIEGAKNQTGYDAHTLQTIEFPPIKFIVDGYIPEGETIFSGRPKLGKSWAVLGIAIAVATGSYAFGNILCGQGDVLYLALEDNPRRLKKRMTKLLGDMPWPTTLRLETRWPRLHEGGAEKIKEWIESKPNPRLVIIDTLGKIMGERKQQDSAYLSDYKAMEELQMLASDKGLAIVIVHHVRKLEAEDPIDTVSGTLGLAGAADTILVLNRNAQGVTLYGRGRDIEEIETVMKFDKDSCRWGIVGLASDVRKSDERTDIIHVLDEIMQPMAPNDVAQSLGKKSDAVRQMLMRMAKAGDIQKVGRGKYASNKVTPDEEDATVPVTTVTMSQTNTV